MKSLQRLLIATAVLLGVVCPLLAQQEMIQEHSLTGPQRSSYPTLPAIDFTITFQLGYLGTDCNENVPLIATIGGIVRSHVFRLDTSTTVYLRAGGNAGALPSFDAGLGVRFERGFFAGLSVASMASQDCRKGTVFSYLYKNPMTGALLNFGTVLDALYFELDFYYFFDEKEYIKYNEFVPPGVEPYTRTVRRPLAFAVRVGYIF